MEKCTQFLDPNPKLCPWLCTEIEKWSKLAASEKVTALELDPSQEGLEGRVGLWMFGGNLFLRVVGLPQGGIHRGSSQVPDSEGCIAQHSF
eukprot:s2554_g4.t1